MVFRFNLQLLLLVTPIALASDGKSQQAPSFTEGFGAVDTPPSESDLKGAWESVFQIRNQVRPQYQGGAEQKHSARAGAAFVVHRDGTQVYLLTAAHTLSCTEVSQCELEEANLKFFGKVIAIDPAKDLMLISAKRSSKFDPEPVKFATEKPVSGDKVVAFGFPDLSLRKTWEKAPRDLKKRGKRFSTGKVLSLQGNFDFDKLLKRQRDQVSTVFQEVVMHTADYLKGMSGGPLLNTKGQLVGINQAAVGMNEEDYAYCIGKKQECFQASLSTKEILEFLERSIKAPPTAPKSLLQKRNGL